jgi:RNA polymerase sigma factor (sigma-70 family)
MQITTNSLIRSAAPLPFLEGNKSASKELESRIIDGLKCRDPGAMHDLYLCHGRLVYSAVLRIVGNGGEAEEIAQETFLRVWTRAYLIDNSAGTLRPWLLTIARNLSIDYLRAARDRHFEYTNYESFPSPTVCHPQGFSSDRAGVLRDALAGLPPEQRAVIEFTYFEGMSKTEIAARMRKPVGTVKTWSRAALINLRKRFTSLRVPHESGGHVESCDSGLRIPAQTVPAR